MEAVHKLSKEFGVEAAVLHLEKSGDILKAVSPDLETLREAWRGAGERPS